MKDGDTSPTEFHKILQEVEKYCKMKADIRNQDKTKVKQLTKEQWEEILEQERKEGKEGFVRKIELRGQSKCHLKYEGPPSYGMWF